MPIHSRRVGTTVAIAALAATTFLGACGSDAKRADSTALSADSTLSRDLALANRDSAAQPQLKDVATAESPKTTPAVTTPKATPPRPRPSTPAPTTPKTTTPPAATTTAGGNTATTNTGAASNPKSTGGGNIGTIPSGATLTTAASAKVCTNTNKVGDHVTATLNSAVEGNGATIPAGATVNLTVTELKRSENANDAIVIGFAVNSVTFGGTTYPIEGTVQSAAVDRIKDQPQSKDVQKVAIGAAAGAIAGKILGKSTKATVIGGAAGAAAGAAAASATANYQGCIPSGGNIVIKLTAPASVRA